MKTRSGKRLYMTLAAIEAANNRPTKRRAGMKEMSVPVLCDITPVQAAKRLRKSGRGPVQSSRGSPFDCLPVRFLIFYLVVNILADIPAEMHGSGPHSVICTWKLHCFEYLCFYRASSLQLLIVSEAFGP